MLYSMKKKRTLLLLVLVALFLSTPIFGASFRDISGHWSEGYMLKGEELGWIKGYEDNTLRPDRKITRAEFIALVYPMASLDTLQPKGDSRYGDIAQAPWAEDILRRAEASYMLEEIFSGNQILPNEPITREEASAVLTYSTMLRNLAKKGELDRESLEAVRQLVESQRLQKSDDTILSFTDKGSVDLRFVWAVDHLSGEKILTGYNDGSFKPKGQLSRAEAMVLLLKSTGESPAKIARPLAANAIVVRRGNDFFVEDKVLNVPLTRSQLKDGVAEIGGQRYLIDDTGKLISGFIRRDNKTFYIDREKGMVRGWKQIGDSLYYFSPANYRMYKNGMFSTGEGVYWFGKDGKLKTGNRPGGLKGRKVYWAGPTAKELENGWLTGKDQELRFRGQEIANYAAAFEGQPFHWYGFDLESGKGVYCVGLTYGAHKAFGIHIPGPSDANIRLHKGYELPRVQYESAYKFGGMRYKADFNKAWPGDIIFNYSPNFYLGYNHVGLYMGRNNGRPIYVHATLADGIFIGDCREMNMRIGRRFNKEFVRYNTEQNKGNGQIPEVLHRQ